MTAQFHIDPDIKKAQTVPSAFYVEPDFFQASKERIFARAWHLIGITDGVKTNNLYPVNILEDFLDEPVFVSRTDDGRLHCLSNVCTHRGKILLDNPCEANLIRCAYHGRRFALDGKFLSMPEFEQTENFPAESDDLPKIPFEVWGKFLFAGIKPAAPLSAFTGDMSSQLAWQNLPELKLTAEKTYEVKAHWALYCENFLEGFHIPFVHDALNKELDYGNYSTELFRYATLQTGYDKTGAVAAQYFFVFPNMMFNFYPWGLSLNIVKPVTPGLTKVHYMTFVSDESRLNKGAGAGLERVEFEDQAVVESVQRGIRSRAYDRGRYSPTREQGCHHFHRLIAEFMR
jgi:choline monooxygenase